MAMDQKTAPKIQMVDLKTQYEKIKTEVDTAIQSVIENTAFINGPEVKNFQLELEKYLSVKHVIPCANGTDALQIAMMKVEPLCRRPPHALWMGGPCQNPPRELSQGHLLKRAVGS